MKLRKRNNKAQKTSLEAYKVLQPKLGSLQMMIYNYLKLFYDSSNNDISRDLNISINSVTARINELRDQGLIICSGFKKDPVSRRKNMIWRVI